MPHPKNLAIVMGNRLQRLVILLSLALANVGYAIGQESSLPITEPSGIIRTAVLLTVLAIIPALFCDDDKFHEDSHRIIHGAARIRYA